jgi:DNA-binding PadR family transcriptional regulator
VVKRRKVANLLALAVLSMLRPGYPMHPYQIANVLRRTGKERDMPIKVGSLYTVVRNLERHGFIEAAGSHRAGRRPERTEYVITDAGRAELRDWLSELVAVPEAEYPRFQAALSVLSTLHPDEAAASLQERVRALDDDIAARRDALAHSEGTRRLFLIEAEYALEMRRAEAAWVRCLLAEITDGNFPDLVGWREFHDTGHVPAEFTEMLAEEGGTATD